MTQTSILRSRFYISLQAQNLPRGKRPTFIRTKLFFMIQALVILVKKLTEVQSCNTIPLTNRVLIMKGVQRLGWIINLIQQTDRVFKHNIQYLIEDLRRKWVKNIREWSAILLKVTALHRLILTRNSTDRFFLLSYSNILQTLHFMVFIVLYILIRKT